VNSPTVGAQNFHIHFSYSSNAMANPINYYKIWRVTQQHEYALLVNKVEIKHIVGLEYN